MNYLICLVVFQGVCLDGYRLPFWRAVWRFMFRLHRAATMKIAKLFSIKRVIAVQERVVAEEISSIDAVNIVVRDFFIATGMFYTKT